jgi:glycosyltransferase involved in cell wall biosynthesis
MCEAFSKENDILLLFPKRRNTKELKKVKEIFSYYALDGYFEKKKMFCLDIGIMQKLKMDKLWFFIHSISYSIGISLWILCHRKEFDIIYSRDHFSLYFLSFIRKFLNSETSIFYETHTFPRNKKSFRVRLAKKVDKIVVVTKKIKELYAEAGINENKIIVEPDAVDLDKFNLSISMKKAREDLNIPIGIRVASFVGNFHTMEMEKGIPEIIESAKYLIDEFSDLYFYFIGGPLDREKKYRHIIKKKNLPQKKFVFLKKQPIKDIPLWLTASEILLMPFPKNNHFSYFMSPLKMFEYMASKRPIVGSKLPAIEEILTDGKTALLGEPGKPRSIAKNIKALLLKKKLGKKLAENAFQDVQKYTWEKRARRILKV